MIIRNRLHPELDQQNPIFEDTHKSKYLNGNGVDAELYTVIKWFEKFHSKKSNLNGLNNRNQGMPINFCER
jgi:hypothetical protein